MKRSTRPPVITLFIGALSSFAFIPTALALNDAGVNDIDMWFDQIANNELSAGHNATPAKPAPSDAAPVKHAPTTVTPVSRSSSTMTGGSSAAAVLKETTSSAKATTVPSTTPPVAAPQAKPVTAPLPKPAPYVEPTRIWTASSGQTLRDTISVWAATADCSAGTRHWTVAWSTATNYRIDAPLHFSGTFKQALNEIFQLYLGANIPLYAGTHSGQCTIKVDDKPVR